MTTPRIGAALLATTISTPAFAEKTIVFTEPVGGVYVQEWLTDNETIYGGGVRTTVVYGAGKSGDFRGELYIDCPNPSASRWISVNGDFVLDASDVPLGAILAIREKLCALN